MAKKSDKKSEKKEKEKEPDIAGFMAESLDEAQKKFGKVGAYVGAEDDSHYCGIQIPTFAMRWLIDGNVWPLQAMTLGRGAPKSCKSAFGYELERWFLMAGGGVKHVDTEKKASGSLMRSMMPEYFILGDPRSAQVIMAKATTVQEWQSHVTLHAKKLRKYVITHGHKPPFPVLIVIDSLLGADSEEGFDKVNENLAAADRQFSGSPMSISLFLKSLSTQMLGYPMSVHIVNHEKPSMSGGAPRTPGGEAPKFHCVYDMRFMIGDRAGGDKFGRAASEINRADEQGMLITIGIERNSYGSAVGREMVVPFMWRFETDETSGRRYQVSWWDWHTATGTVLSKLAPKLKAVMDVTSKKKSGSGLVITSKTLGVEEVKPFEFGEAFEANPELVAAVENELGIHQHNVFAPGIMDFEDDVAHAKRLDGGDDE